MTDRNKHSRLCSAYVHVHGWFSPLLFGAMSSDLQKSDVPVAQQYAHVPTWYRRYQAFKPPGSRKRALEEKTDSDPNGIRPAPAPPGSCACDAAPEATLIASAGTVAAMDSQSTNVMVQPAASAAAAAETMDSRMAAVAAVQESKATANMAYSS